MRPIRHIRKQLHRYFTRSEKARKSLAALAKEREEMNAMLPFDVVQQGKKTVEHEMGVKKSEVGHYLKLLKTLEEATGQYYVVGERRKRNVPSEITHRDTVTEILKRYHNDPVAQDRVRRFAEQIDMTPFTVRLKRKHHEGEFDVGAYIGNELHGWIGLAYNRNLHALTIESIQGQRGFPGSMSQEMAGQKWYIFLANHISNAILESGARRIALINWDNQAYAKGHVESKGLYRTVERVLKSMAKKAVKTKDGKYTLFLLESE
ncbi:MAG: hypothetical protein IPJ89_05510 [Candidatus Iainarchaeum archaeon]|uniref:Uncharacterized protein n=1 Tax=Candidatus Iainarchaeum sp. TaxID=3101447 RepID=A0A7T9I1Q0_9ARCH|nr:MAG: hypothetical protein IPJ89_05510 [Candidatus Diapherotrites archaeon]